MGEDQQGPEGQAGDIFEVTMRIGDSLHTVGYAGEARISGVTFDWTAEFTESGLRIDPRPSDGGTWDAVAEQWVLPDGSIVTGESLLALLTGLDRVLQGGTDAAGALAREAYDGAITEAFGDLLTQQTLYDI